MGVKFFAKVEGVEFTAKALRNLGEQFGDKPARRAVRGAMRKAIRPTMATMRAAIPVGSRTHRLYNKRLVPPGHAKRSIRSSITKNRRTGGMRARIGVAPDAFYAVQFVPFGIARTARVTPQDWIISTFEQETPQMVRIFNEELGSEVEKEVARFSRRQRITV